VRGAGRRIGRRTGGARTGDAFREDGSFLKDLFPLNRRLVLPGHTGFFLLLGGRHVFFALNALAALAARIPEGKDFL